MLDLDHPMTPHIFHASRLIDGVMIAGQEMTVAPSAAREDSLNRCLPPLAEMRELNRQHFGDSAFIAQAIDEFGAGLRALAALGEGRITEDRRDGKGRCPHCRTRITCLRSGVRPSGYVILCQRCNELIVPPRLKLCSREGFDTDAI